MIDIMSADIIAALVSMDGRDRPLAEGEYLFHLDEAITAFFVVLDGRIDLVRYMEKGAALILQRAGPGEILAEASLFSTRYHCDAVARTNACVRRIPKQTLRERFRQEPEFAEALAAHLAREVQQARFHSEVLSLRMVAQRLDAWQGWYGRLPPKGEWRQLADRIGVSPEALYREMAKRRKPM